MGNEKERIFVPQQTIKQGSGPIYFGQKWDESDVEYVRADLLATVRAEEREAAFKILCPECAGGIKSVFDESARWYYHGEGRVTVGCSASKLRIALEAATENRKGEG